MKNIMKTIAFVAFLLAMALPVAAQTAVTRTTLSSAVAAGSQNTQVVLASATGISASPSNSCSNYLLVDREFMCIRALSGTTATVARAQVSTAATGHKSGAQVIFGAGGATFNPNTGNTSGVFLGGASLQPTGSCTRTNQQYLPVFSLPNVINNGFTYDCLGGKWVQGTMPDAPDATPLILSCTTGENTIGNVAYASLGTSATNVAGTTFYSSIMVPKTAWVTGLTVLQGGTATTDSEVAILRDSSFNLIANGSTTGTALSGANTFLPITFTSSRFVVGPARYFIGIQGSGSVTGSIRTIATSTFNNVVTTSTTGTFGVIPATGTAPTTFTLNVGPVACLTQ